MKWLITGSVAQYHWFKDSRTPLDIDLLTPAKVIGNNSQLCVVDCSWHSIAEEILTINKDPIFADPDILFTLKVSHAHWNVKWDKTMFDINFLKAKNCVLNVALYKKLLNVWEEIHGSKKHVNLIATNEEFFDDGVFRKYDHDLIHKVVAFNEKPMHERIRPNLDLVWCSEEMFLALPLEQQYEVALEEILVTAIERSNLTLDSRKSDIMIAVNRAHKQLVTSMTKGWFARFLILNQVSLIFDRKEKWNKQLTKALQKLSTRLPLKSWRDRIPVNG